MQNLFITLGRIMNDKEHAFMQKKNNIVQDLDESLGRKCFSLYMTVYRSGIM
jgi:hypothetical protein